ncbi:MAG TPA: Lrp/AsnC family transcriptional regulator [Limnochorda sp.]
MTEAEFDALDKAILLELQRDGRAPFTSIAARLNVAEGTVRKRVNRLVDRGVLRLMGIIDPVQVGRTIQAIVGIRVGNGHVEEVVEHLRSLPQVRYLGVSAGAYDLIVEVVVASNEELYQFLTKQLRQVPGVVASDTSMILKVFKDRYEWRPYEDDQPAARETGE